jgi:Zn-dependent M16 (insulinase) family peptidase
MPFARSSAHPVVSLGVTLETWHHPCGMVHYHLACADEHRAFTIAFRTPPADSTGLPHILEHTTLCGSQKYPVRDPFFNMLRRSLQTFMNAMTFPDLTAYPFATQVGKDWRNLLDVYLDAVFAPRLHALDFAQEGHRLSPLPSEKSNGWERQGVVFNEMKGAMDSSDAQVEAVVAARLLPDTIYAHNSGGDPADIPRLTHADLVAFHQRCYCPANAVVLTYGDGDPTEIHRALEPYLGAPGVTLPPPPVQAPLGAAQTCDVAVPWAEGQDALDVATTGVTWVWGDGAELDEVLTGELIDRLLLGHAGAPLRQALESSGLGRSVGSSGYSANYRNGQFAIELDGIAPEDYAKLPTLAETVLQGIVRDGMPAADIEAALHQVELSRREIHGDHYPYGLELCFRLLTPWNLGVEPLAFLDQNPAIARLAGRARQPGWLAAEVQRRFLDNPHRLWARAIPDHAWHARRQQQEEAQTAAAIAAMNPAQITALHHAAAELAKRQATKDDPRILPDLQLSDVPAQRRWVSGTVIGAGESAAKPTTVFKAGTNGVLHLLAAVPLPELTAREFDLLPLAIQCLAGTGVGERSYGDFAAHLTAVSGGVWAWMDVSADVDDAGHVRGWLFAEVKGLATRHSEFLPLLREVFARSRFDEHERITELIDQSLSRLQDRVTSGGSQLAARAAQRGFAGAAGLSHRSGGLGRLAWLKSTAAELAADPQAIVGLAAELQTLVRRLAELPAQTALIGDAAERAEIIASARSTWPVSTIASAFQAPAAHVVRPTAFTTATAVNYCALAFAVAPLGHADAAALSIAGRLLTYQVLHAKLREQGGAYGGGASYQGGSASFALTSYRDPRLEATYSDMRDALRWLRTCPDDAQMMKEAILGVLASLDAPGSPAGECRSRFSGDLKGTGPARLDAYRAAILRTTAADVRAVAERHLDPEGGTPAVICSPEAATRLGWDTVAI